MGHHLYLWVDGFNLVFRRSHFGSVDIFGVVNDLPLQVGDVDKIKIDNPQLPTPPQPDKSATGAPNPPVPISNTRAAFSRFCPSSPTSGSSRWRL